MSDDVSTVEYRDIQGFPGYRVGSDGTVWTCADPAVRSAIDSDAFYFLAKLRNVIIHNSGKADKAFTDAVTKHSSLSTIAENQTIVVTGEMVMEMIQPAIASALALIRAVDDWMVVN